MNIFNYLKKKGLKRVCQVIWQYKVDLVIQRLFAVVFKKQNLQNIIIIESHNDFDSNGGAFYNYLIKNKYNDRYKIVWLIRNKKPDVLPLNVECYGIYKPSLKKNYYLSNAKYILTCQDALGIIREGQRAYYLTHGAMALKNTKGNISVSNSITYILAPSEYLKPIQANLLSIPYPNDKQIILGYPCHDVLYNLKSGDLGKVTEHTFKKVVLWMPTFRKSKIDNRNDSSIEYTMGIPIVNDIGEYEKLNSILNSLETLLIIKIHPMQDLEQIKIYSHTNIIVIDGNKVKELNIDNYRLMVDADAMISDYSSSGTDFLHTGRPIAYTLDDLTEYRLGFIVENPKDLMPGMKIYCFNDLIDFFELLNNVTDEYYNQRKLILNRMFTFHDGNSCSRLAEHIGL
mgnify:FL=1